MKNKKTLKISQATVINEGQQYIADLWIEGELITQIAKEGIEKAADQNIDAKGLWLIPGVIDDQVHFREPGLTHKASIATESRAAVAGGVTSFMEMPNTIPQALTQKLLQDKYDIASNCSPANYSFFMGASNDNLEEVLKTNPKQVCGVKIFMGSSTGNMLVDNEKTLSDLFSRCEMLMATHCEDEETIRKNEAIAREKYGEDVPWKQHPVIRSHQACYLSSSLAVNLAKKHNARLHILHITTARELELFEKGDINSKRITSEVCVHHLNFNDSDYETQKSLIKCNPAVKTREDQEALWEALNNGVLDIIATDHAPHTWEEKQNPYFKAPSGVPLVQHTLLLMLRHAKNGKITPEKMVEKMCHAPADCFQVNRRGYIREGYFADLVLIDPNKATSVSKNNILYKCNWSPFEGRTFNHSVNRTIVNGEIACENGKVNESIRGKRLQFNR